MSVIYDLERAAPMCRHCKTKMDWHSTQAVEHPKHAVLDIYRCERCERMEAVIVQIEQAA